MIKVFKLCFWIHLFKLQEKKIELYQEIIMKYFGKKFILFFVKYYKNIRFHLTIK